ncbi:MAG: hypothetical protein ACKOE6_16165 [Flammeovirgaceae bacterium]
MRTIIFALAAFCTVFGHAQTFEGVVIWSITGDIKDPQMKAQMEQAQRQMADPANQAKMKAAMDKMNDPQMKALMESNPQLKAQMESMMKMAQGGGGMESMVPKSLVVKARAGNVLTILEGGMMPMETLYQSANDKSFIINRKDKTYSVASSGNGTDAKNMPSDVKVKKTNETMKILNYTCVKFLATVKMGERMADQIFWTTTEIKDFDMASLRKQRFGWGQQFF